MMLLFVLYKITLTYVWRSFNNLRGHTFLNEKKFTVKLYSLQDYFQITVVFLNGILMLLNSRFKKQMVWSSCETGYFLMH